MTIEMDTPRHQALIVQVTHACNLSCAYCFDSVHRERGRMSLQTLEALITRTLDELDGADFTWHGGEPLLMGLDFYRRAVELQRMFPGKKVANGFQTNGTLVTDEVLDFCQEHEIGLGISLDGPAEIHGRTRRFRDGSNSFEPAFRAAIKARDRRLGGCVIVVVNRQNVGDVRAIYDFARSEGLNLKMNWVFPAGRARDHGATIGLEAAQYGRAMIELFDAWLTDGSEVRIDSFELLIGNLITSRPWGCQFRGGCGDSILAVSPAGDVFPCERFTSSPEFRMGNINEDRFPALLASEMRCRIRDRRELVAECRDCDHRQICNAGCIHNALLAHGDVLAPDPLCDAYRSWFAHMGAIVDRELSVALVDDDPGIPFRYRGRPIDPSRIRNGRIASVFRLRVQDPVCRAVAEKSARAARAYAALGRPEQALHFYRDALSWASSASTSGQMGPIVLGLAHSCLSCHRPAEALEHALRSIDLLRERPDLLAEAELIVSRARAILEDAGSVPSVPPVP